MICKCFIFQTSIAFIMPITIRQHLCQRQKNSEVLLITEGVIGEDFHIFENNAFLRRKVTVINRHVHTNGMNHTHQATLHVVMGTNTIACRSVCLDTLAEK